MTDKIEKYEIVLEKEVFFPGEMVKGSLLLSTKKEMSCKGVRLELIGIGKCRFTTGSGDNQETRQNEMYYCHDRLTVWGKLFTTQTIEGGGSDPVFNPPWLPNEGLLMIPVVKCTTRGIVLRVMDEDFGKKDDLLGEVYVVLEEVMREKQPMTLDLYRKGQVTESSISFSMEWLKEEDVYSTSLKSYEDVDAVVRILVHACRNLKKADFIGKNDVYVQGYVPEDVIDMDKPLPTIGKKCVMPEMTLKVPFQFLLPKELPSSLEMGYGNFVRYSIYSCVDIAWKKDPSTRTCFTVVDPRYNASLLTNPMMGSQVKMVKPSICIPPFCCCFFELPCKEFGNVSIDVKTDKSLYAPNEAIQVNVKAQNQTSSKKIKIQCILKRISALSAEGFSRTQVHNMREYEIAQLEPGQLLDETIPLIVPSLPPNFTSTYSKRQDWLRMHPRGSTLSGFSGSHASDPITWNYELSIFAKLSMATKIKLNFQCSIGAGMLLGNAYQPLISDTPTFSDTSNVLDTTNATEASDTTNNSDAVNVLDPTTNKVKDPIKSVFTDSNQQAKPFSFEFDVQGAASIKDDEEDLNSLANLTYTPKYVCSTKSK